MLTQELLSVMEKQGALPGRNPGAWPGLTVYRFDEPVPRQWDELQSLALCMVARGRKIVTAGGVAYYYDPAHYLVVTRQQRVEAEVLDGSPEAPFYSLVLQVPALALTELMLELEGPPAASPAKAVVAPAYVSRVTPRLVDAMVRFLRAQDSDVERRVLAPSILREILYYLLTEDQAGKLMVAAMRETATVKIQRAVRLMIDRCGENLSVAEMASAIGVSESTFAHKFKEVTSVSPMQYLKQVRLEQSRRLLVEGGRSVSEAAEAVGYANSSHFSTDFKRAYGESPAKYVSRLSGFPKLQLVEDPKK